MPQLRLTRILKVLPALLLVALVIPAASSAQATRTWVSGVGDDVNPCSRTAPCKTFAGAISKTARGGIINALDDGGFGTVTITKSITIDGGKHMASILSSGTNGVNVNITDLVADPRARVVLRNLSISGNGTTLGFAGIRMFGSTKSLKIHNVNVHDFSQNAIEMKTTTPGVSRLSLTRSDIYDNGGSGLAVAPATGVISVATVRDTDFDGNQCGAAASQFGIGLPFTGLDCGASAPNANTGTAVINVFDSGFADNVNAGVLANGANSTIRLSNNDVMGNALGLRQVNSGQVRSFGNNKFGNNGSDGVPNGLNLGLLKGSG